MDIAGILISGASLAVGIAALCLNEKKEGEEVTEETPEMRLKIAKQEKKDANKVRKATKMAAKADKAKKQTMIRQYAGGIGYNGPIILLNTEHGEQEFGIVPLENKKIVRERQTRPLPMKKTEPSEKSWVAMEINARSGGDRQAIVCKSKADAEARALAMKRAHRSGSRQSKDCIQGYALMDTSDGIDVAAMMSGNGGQVHRV